MEGGMLAKSATEGVPERWDRHVFATKHRVTRADSDDPTVTMWEFLQGGRWTMPSEGGLLGLDFSVPADAFRSAIGRPRSCGRFIRSRSCIAWWKTHRDLAVLPVLEKTLEAMTATPRRRGS
jgi:hypothetical protein